MERRRILKARQPTFWRLITSSLLLVMPCAAMSGEPNLRIEKITAPSSGLRAELGEAVSRQDAPQTIHTLNTLRQLEGEQLPDLLLLADAFRVTGNHAASRRWLTRAKQLAPNDPELGVRHWERVASTAPEQAEPALRQLVAQFPELASAHFVLAQLLAKQMRWHEALTYFRHAAEIAAPLPVAEFNAAVALDHLGHKEEACTTYLSLARQALTPDALRAEATRRLSEITLEAEAAPYAQPPKTR